MAEVRDTSETLRHAAERKSGTNRGWPLSLRGSANRLPRNDISGVLRHTNSTKLLALHFRVRRRHTKEGVVLAALRAGQSAECVRRTGKGSPMERRRGCLV